MIDLRDLRVVMAIAANGTLVRAARALGMSQPAVTRSLAALEERLGGKLFERHRHGVIPTNLARVLLAETSDIPGRMDQLEQRLRDVSDTEGELRIATGNYAGDILGLRAATLMSSRHPTLRLRLMATDWVETPRASSRARRRLASLKRVPTNRSRGWNLKDWPRNPAPSSCGGAIP